MDSQAEAQALAEVKRDQDTVQALAQKQLAERMASQAYHDQGQPSADADKLLTEAKRLAEQMETSQSESEVESLERRLLDLEAQSSLAASGSELARAHNDQVAALEKRLAELQKGFGSSQSAPVAGRRVKRIDIEGLSSAARDELLSKLPVHVGDTMAEDSMEKLAAVAKQFDEHLSWSVFTTSDGQVEIRIETRGSSDRREPPQ